MGIGQRHTKVCIPTKCLWISNAKMPAALEGSASPILQPDNGHNHEPVVSTFHRHNHSWRPVLFWLTGFNASSRSNFCNLMHRVRLLGLGYRKASSYEEQHKCRKTATSIHCWIGIRNQDPSTQGEEWLPRKPDPAPCDLVTCGSANQKVYPRRPKSSRWTATSDWRYFCAVPFGF
jgi:hypothetical protein